jgi:flagellar hook-basal body complex protein FliE
MEAITAIAAQFPAVTEPSLQPSLASLTNQVISAPGQVPGGPFGFASLVTQGLDEVNRQLAVSQTDLQQLATGDVQNLHQIMIRLEESRLSFQLLMQVRNRLLEAYQDVMRMSV